MHKKQLLLQTRYLGKEQQQDSYWYSTILVAGL